MVVISFYFSVSQQRFQSSAVKWIGGKGKPGTLSLEEKLQIQRAKIRLVVRLDAYLTLIYNFRS